MKDNPKLMKEIFGNDLPKLSSLRSAINRATHRPEGTVNHPGTAVAISKIAQEAFQKFALAMGLSGDVTSYILINSASKATKGAGRTYSKGVKPALPQSSFASALMAAGGVEGHRSLSPQPSANNRNERGNR
ncbi:hypothetical protein [Sneathiella glossodoripedis]|uniref:hypothetical protein n=1 Tax=Sneathiella glossodoripedis TaxID=418853 RepID=UPI0011DDEADC|nr:hypothetical protein [Sneathiella glossodoripedis]